MESEVIFSYTRQDAINDGVFMDVTNRAKERGFLVPVAITTNLFCTLIKSGISEEQEDYEKIIADRLDDFLHKVMRAMMKTKKDNLMYLQIWNGFDTNSIVDVWVAIEAQSPTDLSPAINILLPEDY